MADQAITALPKKTYSGSSQIASTDYLLGIDSAEGYQMLIQDLGEYIINRATASLAGSTQTLASAINALNSKLGKLKLYRSTTGKDSSTAQTFNVSDLTSDDYPIFLFTAGFSTTYISAMIYLNRGTEDNIAYGIISAQGRNITSVTYDVANKKIIITLDNSVYRSGALLRLQ